MPAKAGWYRAECTVGFHYRYPETLGYHYRVYSYVVVPHGERLKREGSYYERKKAGRL
jgi:hypothetical protein